jgi:Coenzyme PQQ synthesis protein D (PqqD)
LADDPAVWRRSPDVAVVDGDTRVVVLGLADPATARPLVMEGPAAAIWHALEEPGTTAQVVQRVAADFGLPVTEVETDVSTFIVELRRRRLVLPG